MLLYERSGRVKEIVCISIYKHKITDESETVLSDRIDETATKPVRLSCYGTIYPVASIGMAEKDAKEWADEETFETIRLYRVIERHDVSMYLVRRMVEEELEGGIEDEG